MATCQLGNAEPKSMPDDGSTGKPSAFIAARAWGRLKERTAKGSPRGRVISWRRVAESQMEWNDLENKVKELKQPSPEKEMWAVQQQIRCRIAELSIGGGKGSLEKLLDCLDNIDVSKRGTDAHRYALRTLDDLIHLGQGLSVRDSLDDLMRHLREAIEKLS